MQLVKTVKSKLEVPEHIKPILHDTLLKFANACNDILKVSIEHGTSNKVKIQHLCYKEIKERYGLQANLVIRAIARVCASRKSKNPVKEFRPTSIEYDARTFSMKFVGGYHFISLSTTQGRIKGIRLSIGNYQLGLLKDQKPTSATLVWDKRKKIFYLHIVLSNPVPPPRETKKYVGVDLGINRIATASNGVEFKIKNLKQVRNHYLKVRASLQKKGTKGAKRLLKRLSGKERRICKQINHIISKQLVASLSEGDCLVFENLKYIRQRVRLAKKQRRRLHSWSFGQLINFCTYKALAKENTVLQIAPRNSSRECSRCHHISRKNRQTQALFRCTNCGFQHNADLNGSIILAQRAGSMSVGYGQLALKVPASVPGTSPPALAVGV